QLAAAFGLRTTTPLAVKGTTPRKSNVPVTVNLQSCMAGAGLAPISAFVGVWVAPQASSAGATARTTVAWGQRRTVLHAPRLFTAAVWSNLRLSGSLTRVSKCQSCRQSP